jgi:tetratricopeptide (TPR) repeat protein
MNPSMKAVCPFIRWNSRRSRPPKAFASWAVACAALLFAANPRNAHATSVSEVAGKAQVELRQLEYEAAEQGLLEATKNPDAFPPKERADLLILLGQAQAELGKVEEANKTFREAVILNPEARLSPVVSPKIRAMLEHARMAAVSAPPQEVVQAPTPAPTPAPAPTKKAKPAAPPSRVSTSKAISAAPVPQNATPKIMNAPVPQRLEIRTEGSLSRGSTARVVVSHAGFPRETKFQISVRRSMYGPFITQSMTKTATSAEYRLRLDRPRIEMFVEALRGAVVAGRIGSPSEPLVVRTGPEVPDLESAWSATEPSPSQDAPVRYASSPQELDSDDSDVEIVVLVVGVALAIAGVTALAIAVGSSSGSTCQAPSGYGCADIVVGPGQGLSF